jgi:hypothetical protein
MKIEITNGVETPVTKFFSAAPETHRIVRNAEIADHPPTRLAATLTVKCEKLERERDEWRKKFELSVDAVEIAARLARAESERDEARGHCESIVERANELIARWDAPSWKDTAPTARFINALRIAVRAYERTK